MNSNKFILCLLMIGLALQGCQQSNQNTSDQSKIRVESGNSTKKTLPVFTLEWSEYPSWSSFDVASTVGVINGEEGQYSPLEEKYGVDIVLKRRDYVQSMKEYSASQTDAVCVTNIDALNLAKGRPSTAILPTSTSDGADGVITVGMKNIGDLKGKDVYGAEDSVSEYMVHRCLEVLKEHPKKVHFKNMEPGEAAIALQTGGANSNVKAIATWQPFLLQTLRTRPDAKLQFTSSEIKLEIIDMVLVGNSVLARPKGEDFAKAVVEAYYIFNKRLENPEESDKLVVMIGKKFSNLDLKDMHEVLTKCKFFKTPEAAKGVFGNPQWQKLMTSTVVKASKEVGIVTDENMPSIGFNDSSKDFNFSTKYLTP